MEIIGKITNCFRKTFVLSGRADRTEFWSYFIFFFLVCASLFALQAAFGTQAMAFDERTGTTVIDDGFLGRIVIWLTFALPFPLTLLLRTPALFLAFVMVSVPLFSAAWRRLLDTGRPGWLVLIPLIAQLLSVPSFYAMWFVMGDATPPEGLAAILAVIFMLLSWVAGIVATGGWIILAFLLSRPSTPGDGNEGLPMSGRA